MTMEDQVILVNEKDEGVGIGEKITTHQQGLLHRAFSVFIFNSKGELLLQRRAFHKYHSPGLWSNTCCGHPQPAEVLMEAAQRRLKTEMGLTCPLKEIGSFIYRADVGDGLVEHEYDHLLIGNSDQNPSLNLEEAVDSKWVRIEPLKRELGERREHYTCWLKVILDSHLGKFPTL